MLVSWVGSIYYWSLLRQVHAAWSVTLVMLVLLGIFIAPFYVIGRARG